MDLSAYFLFGGAAVKTVYKFYLKPHTCTLSSEGLRLPPITGDSSYALHSELKIDNISSNPLLYAITDSKVLYKLFKSQRDMDKFIIEKCEMKESEALYFLGGKDSYCRLKDRKYNTRNEDDESDEIVTPISIVSTEFESENSVTLSDGLWGLLKLRYPADIFDEDYYKPLQRLWYAKVANLFRNGKSIILTNSIDVIGQTMDFTEYDKVMTDALDIKEQFIIDEFQIFMFLYGGTFKV